MAEFAMGVPAGVPAACALNVARLATAASSAAKQFPARQTDTKRVTATLKKDRRKTRNKAAFFVSEPCNTTHNVTDHLKEIQSVTISILKWFDSQKYRRMSYSL